MKFLSRLKNIRPVIAIPLAIIAVLLAGVLYFTLRTPGDLGPRVQYIGKHISFCPLIVLCDGPTSETYFFATDLGKDELPSYFHRLKYLGEGGGSGNSRYRSTGFEFKDLSGEIRSYEYYDKSYELSVIKSFGLQREEGKPYIIRIYGNKDMKAFKESHK